MEFPWRCNVDTIAMDLKVSWEMSVKSVSDKGRTTAPLQSTRNENG